MITRWAATAARLWHDCSGVTAIITALAAIVLVGFTGLAIDVVVWELTQHKMQGAADAAALAGSIAAQGNQNVTDAADAMAASYGFANGQNGTSVTVTYPYLGNEVEVVISQPQPQFFSRLFLRTAPTVRVQAAANLPARSGTMCVLALGGSGYDTGNASFSGNGTVDLSNCDLYNNSNDPSSTQLGGHATLDARNLYLAGDYTVGGSATLSLTGAAATYVQPASDPYAGMSIPSYSGCNQTNYSLSPNQSATISPGVYCGGMDIKGTLIFNPGVYILDGGGFTANAQASITGTGVTIILTSSTGSSYGTITINGGATISLSAPTTGATAGIVLWVDKNASYGATDKINGGSSQNINGVMYLPSQQVSFIGGSSQSTTCAQLIALTVSFSGNSDSFLTLSGCSAAGIPIKQPPLPPTLAS
jgi:hypothetical protein